MTPNLFDGRGAAFRFFSPTTIVFGDGVLDRAGDELGGFRRPLVVTGRTGVARAGFTARLLAALEPHVESVEVSAVVSPNPRLDEVEQAAAAGRAHRADVVIGLGGGSALDAAKAVAAAVGSGAPIAPLFREGKPAPPETLPIICIPTTAGTGSETSQAAILSDPEANVKSGLRGKALAPRLALVDPELTASLPERVRLETGFDVLTHAVETWASRKASPLTTLFSQYAITTVAHMLPRLKSDPADADARRNLSLASTLMGLNLANSSTCLPHRLQYPVGALTDTSHPAGLAALYPAWSRATAPHAPEVFGFLAAALGEPAGDPAAAVAGWLESLGIAVRLRDLGVENDALGPLAVAVAGDLSNDPGDTAPAALLDIYRRSW